MTPNERLELRLAYEVAVENYLSAFMKQYDLTCDPEPWVGNEIGTIVEVGDHFFGFDDIKRCVDEDVEWQDLIEWYDYNCEGGMLGLNQINLKSWLMGAPRASKENIAEIKARRKELEELIKNQNDEKSQSIYKSCDWLKSIKPNHWKPSEEQIKSLRIALQTMPYSKDKENVLVILEELEKL